MTRPSCALAARAALAAAALLSRAALAAPPRFESVPAPLLGTHVIGLSLTPLSMRAAAPASFGVSVGGGPAGAPWRTFEVSARAQGGGLRCLTGGKLLPAETCRFDGASPLPRITLLVEPGALKMVSGPSSFFSLADDFPGAAGLQFRVVSSGAAALSAVKVQTEEEVAVGEIDFRSPAHAFAVHGNVIRFAFAPTGADGPASFGVIVGPGERRFMVTRKVTAAGEHRCITPDGAQLPLEVCDFKPLAAGADPCTIRLVVEPGSFSLKEGSSTWALYDHFPNDVTSFRLASSGVAISRLSIVSEEEDWREGQIKAGASQSDAGSGEGLCDASAAFCGGHCWSVCLHCGPPRYCMCYPDGYRGVSGVFHPGAACLKHDGDGESVESPMVHSRCDAESIDENEGYRAYEGGGHGPRGEL